MGSNLYLLALLTLSPALFHEISAAEDDIAEKIIKNQNKLSTVVTDGDVFNMLREEQMLLHSSSGYYDTHQVQSMPFVDKRQPCDTRIFTKITSPSYKSYSQPPLRPTVIDMKAIVISLDDFSDVHGVISLAVRLDFRWNDSRLAVTNCSDSYVRIAAEKIWFPHWIVQNSVEQMMFPDTWEKFPAVIRGDGYVQWQVPLKLALSCETDLSLFPFDHQYCMILLQSPHFLGKNELNYTVANQDRAVVLLSRRQAHQTFTITGQYVLFTWRVPGVQFWIRLERNPSYYVWLLVVPSLSLAIATGCPFLIPGNGSEKMIVSVAVFLGYLLLLSVFTSFLPPSSNRLPVILPFFVFNLLLSAIVIVLTGFIVRNAYSKQQQQPNQDDAETKNDDEESDLSVAFIYRDTGNGADTRKKSPAKTQQQQQQLTASGLNKACLIGYFVVSLIVHVTFIGHVVDKYYKHTPSQRVEFTDVFNYVQGE